MFRFMKEVLSLKKAFKFFLLWASQGWNKSKYLCMNFISFHKGWNPKSIFSRLSDKEKIGLTPAIYTTFGWVINKYGEYES